MTPALTKMLADVAATAPICASAKRAQYQLATKKDARQMVEDKEGGWFYARMWRDAEPRTHRIFERFYQRRQYRARINLKRAA